MKFSGNIPAVQQAFNFVKSKLDQGVWRQGDRLPSLRSLATMATVSKASMTKAVALLKGEGLISGIERHRMKAGRVISAPEPVQEKLLPWQQKRILLEKEIVSGTFGLQRKLPQLKELQARYGICYSTMKKILAVMVEDGVIQPRGKGYSLPAISAQPFAQKIVFITWVGHFAQESALNHEHNRIVNIFENECKRIGLSFELIEVDFLDSVESLRSVSKIADSDLSMGFILDVWWYTDEKIRYAYTYLLLRLAALKKPTALLDELGTFELPVQFNANRLLQAYRIEGKTSGERMARYLLSLGHTSAVYISPFKTAWSRERFDGVTAQFSRTGHASGVQLVTGTVDLSLEYLYAASGLEDNDIRQIIAIDRTPVQAKNQEELWLRHKKMQPVTITGDPGVDGELRKILITLTGIIRQNFFKETLEDISRAALGSAGFWLFEMVLKPLFEKALANRDATAWICSNDAIALRAIKFLRERNIPVPENISVVGFDNLPVSALENRLTTFDFNAMSFIHQMLNFVIRPPRLRGQYRYQPIEVEGMIIERATAGKAKKVEG